MFKIVVDTHTHTISSGHAYSTVQEIAEAAPGKGIKMFAITDHGPSMTGAPTLFHFGSLWVIPSEINGVRILRGAEVNILNYEGKTDIPNDILKRLDFVIASFHDVCITPSTIEEHTNAAISILKNPYIDAIAHSGNPLFQIDIDKVVRTAKEYNKCLEINNSSFVCRKGSEKNCYEIARKCKEHGVRMICGSDAHVSFSVGNFDNVYKLFESEEIPEELVLNASVEKFEQYLISKKKRILDSKIQGAVFGE